MFVPGRNQLEEQVKMEVKESPWFMVLGLLFTFARGEEKGLSTDSTD
jgi:hypothetical protein